MKDPNRFFIEPQPAAALKLGVFSRHVSIWAAKTGKHAAGNKVVLWDAYAGKGRYDNGAPGSPALALTAAERLAKATRGRRVRCLFTEINPRLYSHLDALVAGSGIPGAEAMRGSAAQHLDHVLRLAAGHPLFVLLDPFGLGLPFKDLTNKLLLRTRRTSSGRRLGPSTEVMLNFSLHALIRNAGHIRGNRAVEEDLVLGSPPFDQWQQDYLGLELAEADLAVQRKVRRRRRSAEQSRINSLKRVDDAMGGSWWQEVWLEHEGDHRAACQAIVSGWRDLIERATGYMTAEIPVGDKWLGAPDYHLMLLTGHDHGLWAFNEACSKAMEDYREVCERAKPTLALTPSLADMAPTWVDEIEANVRPLLRPGRVTVVCSSVTEIFGETAGLAREMHLKKALNRLWNDGLLADQPKGDLTNYVIRLPLARAS